MSRINELNDELQGVRNQKSYLIRHGAENTDQGVTELEEREAEIFRMISEEESREAKESIIAGVQSSESSFSLEADGFVADFRALAVGEDEYQMLSVTTQLYIAKLQHSHAAHVREILEVEKQKQSAIESELDQTRDDLQDVRGKLEVANNRITDIEIERDNAVSEAESFKKQAEELRSQVTKQTGPTNLDGASSLAEINARIEAKKIPVYDVKDEFRSQLGTFTTFKFAETGEYGEIIWSSFKSKYRVLKDDAEVQRFRQELEATKQAEAALVPTSAEPVELVEEFRNELDPPALQNVDAGHQLDEHTTEGQDGQDVAGGIVTREEYEALRKDVEKLKHHVGYSEIGQGAAA